MKLFIELYARDGKWQVNFADLSIPSGVSRFEYSSGAGNFNTFTYGKLIECSPSGKLAEYSLFDCY